MTGLEQPLALGAAFWTAVLLYRGDRPLRFIAALALGAGLAHLGWALLLAPAVLRRPESLLDLSSGFSVLFLPLGLVLLERSPAAFAPLPLAIAVARLGCAAAGCCRGVAGPATPWLEIVGLVAVHALLRRTAPARVGPRVLAGLGLLRGLAAPWRASPALGEPLVAPGLLAGLLLAAGLAWSASRGLSARWSRC